MWASRHFYCSTGNVTDVVDAECIANQADNRDADFKERFNSPLLLEARLARVSFMPALAGKGLPAHYRSHRLRL